MCTEPDSLECYNNLLKRRSIKVLLKRNADNPTISGQIHRAARIFCENQSQIDPVQISVLERYLIRAARIIERGKLQIFVSYKSEEDRKAKEIVNALRELSSNIEVRCAIGYENEIQGEEWRKQVHKDIEWSDWLVLILPEPSIKLDWPLFETGVFYGQRTCPAVEKLLIFHHPNNPVPDPISEIETVKVEFNRLKRTLDKIVKKPDAIPGMDTLWKKADTKKAAERIVDVIQPPSKGDTKFHGPTIALKIKNDDTIESVAQLTSMPIFNLDNYVTRIFGRAPTRESFIDKTFLEFIGDSIDRKNLESIGWLKKLVYEIGQAREDKFVSSIHATFEGQEHNIFRPFIVSEDKHPGGMFTVFYIAFVEDISVVNKDIPKELVLIHTALTFTYRFRWEVIDIFLKSFNKANDLLTLEERITRIETEAQSHGLLDPEALVGFFGNTEADKIRENYAYWDELRNNKKSGKLDIAIRDSDCASVTKIFEKLKNINNWFISILSGKFSEMHTLK